MDLNKKEIVLTGELESDQPAGAWDSAQSEDGQINKTICIKNGCLLDFQVPLINFETMPVIDCFFEQK